MPAITVRNLPESVHGGLRDMAVSRNLSVEALVHATLAEATSQGQANTGMADSHMPWTGKAAVPASEAPCLWGALRGTVHVSPGADITASSGEAWDAPG